MASRETHELTHSLFLNDGEEARHTVILLDNFGPNIGYPKDDGENAHDQARQKDDCGGLSGRHVFQIELRGALVD